MGFWDIDNDILRLRNVAKRRDVTKFGISPAKHAGANGRLLYPRSAQAKPGQMVRYVEMPDGVAFKIGERGDYRVGILNPTSYILFAQAPHLLCRYASDKAVSIEVEDFKGGYFVPFDQFKQSEGG